jgi:hypothetical protein
LRVLLLHGALDLVTIIAVLRQFATPTGASGTASAPARLVGGSHMSWGLHAEYCSMLVCAA